VLLVTVNFCAVNPHELPLLMPIDPEVASVGIVILTEESLTFVMPASRAAPTQAVRMLVSPLPLIVTTVPGGPDRGPTDENDIAPA
jgi:hypothetical protein